MTRLDHHALDVVPVAVARRVQHLGASRRLLCDVTATRLSAANKCFMSASYFQIGQRGAEVDMEGLAIYHQRGHRLDAKPLGLVDAARLLAKMHHLDGIARRIPSAWANCCSADTHTGQPAWKNRALLAMDSFDRRSRYDRVVAA